MDDFHVRWVETQHRIRRARRLTMISNLVIWLLVIAGIALLAIYPEVIGGFFGRIATGFEGAHR